jgi:hypothetical protein
VSEPLTVTARVRAKPDQKAHLLQELKRLPAPTRAEAGGRGDESGAPRVGFTRGSFDLVVLSIYPRAGSIIAA